MGRLLFAARFALVLCAFLVGFALVLMRGLMPPAFYRGRRLFDRETGLAGRLRSLVGGSVPASVACRHRAFARALDQYDSSHGGGERIDF